MKDLILIFLTIAVLLVLIAGAVLSKPRDPNADFRVFITPDGRECVVKTYRIDFWKTGEVMDCE